MKRTIIALALFIVGISVFSACASRQKCPAYGHYSQIEVPQEEKIKS